MKHSKQAFTLVELIVVIAILAILWTISFFALQDYSKSSRNSVRLTDIWIIKQSLWIFKVEAWKYPDPDNMTNVTYSGGLLWSQWSFWNIVFTTLSNLSKIPLDPLLENKYDYSVIHNNWKYQLWSIIEWWLFTLNQWIAQTNAINQNDLTSYITWDFWMYDIKSQVWNDCINITTPSMFVGNIWSTWSINLNTDYTFVYDESSNLTTNYVSKVSDYSTWSTFQIEEVYNSCNIDTLDELNLYISKLSLSYQQLLWVTEFDEVIYNFNSSAFKVWIVDDLKANWISVHNDVVLAVQDTSWWNIYIDTFTWIDSDELISHSSDTLWGWTKTWALLNWSYIISWNSLLKTDNNAGVIFPVPSLPINSIDKSIVFDLIDFWGWSIDIYSSYINSTNYYWVSLTPT